MIIIDGVQYPCDCEITRTLEMRASDISGLLLDGSYFNDVTGTYLKYEVSFRFPDHDQTKYARFHEILTDPVEGHTFIIPYDGSMLTVVGRVEPVSDDYKRLPGGKVYWAGTRFSILSNHPVKQMSLSQVLTRGRLPLPDAQGVSVGDIYKYTADGWEKSIYPDADEMEF